ncbi:hypothetical protein HGT70_14650 [Rosenbergiella collisarenosi]|uniref:hypothetical protein n=1 Tax=Rosenbergiella collisarenosi TaxID=1544695 RepID=UPI001BDAD82F|nr:hypothetical protein [Rosenbergiella collisarenosi]MBT0722508.1 hypothetical protein [Rosenbergiella collisarenosi]
MNTPDEANKKSNTAVITVRNVPRDVDDIITTQANELGKSKSDFIKELLIREFQDLINNYSRTSSLVSLMDKELEKMSGVKVAEHWYEDDMITATNLKYRTLLKLDSVDDLQKIMMKNMPYLQFRAGQILNSQFSYIPRGLSLTFSLFNEIASRDSNIINTAYRKIFYWRDEDIFYINVDSIRAEMKLEPTDRS